MSVYPSEKLFKLLKIIIIVLLAVIALGTAFAYLSTARSGNCSVQDEKQKQSPFYLPPKEYALYGDLGQLRATTVDTPPITVVLKPFLEYKASDTALQEELVAKKEAIKHAVLEWFSLESAYRLSTQPPQQIKKVLMEAVNKQLVLGKIRNIYFEEFVILY